MKRLNRPLVTQETIKAMEDMSFFTHAMIFDDLLIIAQRETSCFVLWTTDGLIIMMQSGRQDRHLMQLSMPSAMRDGADAR